jgi:CheY-like chemotaxis protein
MTKILLVEDDKSLREIYGVRLLAEGYDIVSAGDGEDALAMAIKERPQLIVSDVMMPKISGFDMLDILRSTTETKDIHVIMMTALSSEDQRARGEALGADRYLVKSQVGIEDVVRTVHDVLGDAPVATPSAAQTFGGPAASSPGISRPAAPTAIPPRPMQPSPMPVAPVAAPPVAQPFATPQAPVIATAPTQMSSPVIPPMPQPSQQPSIPTPAPSGLPQPTAPFSTTRPANLGDRIIHPLQNDQEKPDMGSLMAQELTGESQQPVFTPELPTPPTLQQPQQSTQQPATSAPTEPSIGFEETPRQATPVSSFIPGAQPPTNQ